MADDGGDAWGNDKTKKKVYYPSGGTYKVEVYPNGRVVTTNTQTGKVESDTGRPGPSGPGAIGSPWATFPPPPVANQRGGPGGPGSAQGVPGHPGTSQEIVPFTHSGGGYYVFQTDANGNRYLARTYYNATQSNIPPGVEYGTVGSQGPGGTPGSTPGGTPGGAPGGTPSGNPTTQMPKPQDPANQPQKVTIPAALNNLQGGPTGIYVPEKYEKGTAVIKSEFLDNGSRLDYLQSGAVIQTAPGGNPDRIGWVPAGSTDLDKLNRTESAKNPYTTNNMDSTAQASQSIDDWWRTGSKPQATTKPKPKAKPKNPSLPDPGDTEIIEASRGLQNRIPNATQQLYSQWQNYDPEKEKIRLAKPPDVTGATNPEASTGNSELDKQIQDVVNQAYAKPANDIPLQEFNMGGGWKAM